MPIVATVAIDLSDMAMLHVIAPFRHYSRAKQAGPSHWRTYAYRGIADGAPSFELALQPDKARLIRFGRYAARPNSGRLGEGKPETFGFWHHAFPDAITQMGSFFIGRKTIKNRLGAKPPAIKTELRGTMPDSVAKTGALIKRMLQGHLNYFAVSGNHPAVVVLQSGEKAVADVAQAARQTARLSWEKSTSCHVTASTPKPEGGGPVC
jgi:hypothetical protein